MSKKMTTKRRLSCENDYRQLEHLQFLEELNSQPLTDTCCEICHCDCYNSHRSNSEAIRVEYKNNNRTRKNVKNQTKDTNNNNSRESCRKTQKDSKLDRNIKVKVKKKSDYSTCSLERLPLRSKSPGTTKSAKNFKLKRSKSAGSLHGNQGGISNKTHFKRDCELMQELLTSLETPHFEIKGNEKCAADIQPPQTMRASKSSLELPTTSKAATNNDDTWTRPKICESLANLCLAPTVREAYEKVSMHDRKILNRMANKRSEGIMAKENAWLARKFWENERYERELLRCEQMEEYKRAVRDKQFQDYLLTKERLNELAQRDYQELQRLRSNLTQKDELTKQRLDAIRIERDIFRCQRRCEELKKNGAVNLHQEEQNLDDVLRKQKICSRLTHRLRRADEIRNQQLEGYLKRLRYDNLIEQLVHEEHWQEVQELEQLKRAQLKEHIKAKTKNTQRFMEQRQRRMETLTKSAKISASLRELVRSSVTPEGALALEHATSTANLGKILFEPPISKWSFQ